MNDYTPTEDELRQYYIEGRLSIHDGFKSATEDQFDKAIAKIKAEAIREAASGLVDWDVMNGHEPQTAETNISHSNAAYLLREADKIEESAK